MSTFFYSLGMILVGVGFFMLVGTAGSIELNCIDTRTSFVQGGVGLLIIGIGCLAIKIADPNC